MWSVKMYHHLLIALSPSANALLMLLGILTVMLIGNLNSPLIPFGFEGLKPYPGMGTEKPKKPKDKKPKDGFKNDFALVKYSGVAAVGISGKIGGSVFTLGGSMGSFIRNWAKPKNRRTAVQQFVRGVFSGLSSAWRSITSAQVSAWNEEAELGDANSLRKNVFGDNKVISGKDLFQRVNSLNLECGNAVYADPPVSTVTDAITAAVCTADVSATQFDIAMSTFAGAVVVPANTTLIVQATPQLSSGVSFFGKSKYRSLAVYPAATVINPLDIYADYIARFGALVAGSKIGVKMFFVYDNGTGNWGKGGTVYTTATVVA